MIRIVLVDDEPTVRRGLRMRLELTKDISVVGEAGAGAAALQLIRELAPDVVVMDIELPERDGIAVTQTLRAEKMPSAVVILSMHDDPDTRARAPAAGADKFVGKHEGAAALLQAIRDAALRGQARGAGVAALLAGQKNEETSVPAGRSDLKPARRTTRDFYRDYYAVVEASPAHTAFCEYAYG